MNGKGREGLLHLAPTLGAGRGAVAVNGMHDLNRAAAVRADVVVYRQVSLQPVALGAHHAHAAFRAVESSFVP